MDTNKEIELHAARAFFASAWADMQEEKDADDETAIVASMGADVMDLMPDDIDNAAVHAARTLAMDVCRANNVSSLSDLMERVRAIQEETETEGDRPLTEEMLGHYLAMQAMGHGVGLYDAFGREVYERITVPYVEFGSHSLEKDY